MKRKGFRLRSTRPSLKPIVQSIPRSVAVTLTLNGGSLPVLCCCQCCGKGQGETASYKRPCLRKAQSG